MYYVVDLAFDFVGPKADQVTQRIGLTHTSLKHITPLSTSPDTNWDLSFPNDKKISDVILTRASDAHQKTTKVQFVCTDPVIAERPDGTNISAGGICYVIDGSNGFIDIVNWVVQILTSSFLCQGEFIVNAFAHATLPDNVSLGQIHDVDVMDDLQNDNQSVFNVERAKRCITVTQMLVDKDVGEAVVDEDSLVWRYFYLHDV